MREHFRVIVPKQGKTLEGGRPQMVWPTCVGEVKISGCQQHRRPPFENREGWGSLSYYGAKGWASPPIGKIVHDLYHQMPGDTDRYSRENLPPVGLEVFERH